MPDHAVPPSELPQATTVTDPDLTGPEPSLGAFSCFLFVLLLLAFGLLRFLDGTYGPIFDDLPPNQPDAPEVVKFVADLLLFTLLVLPYVGVGVALRGVLQRWPKPWAALLGLALHGSLFLWWFSGWSLPC